MTPVNIRKSFMKTGIYPFDRHIFSEVDFMPSSVTDRPEVVELAGTYSYKTINHINTS